MKKQKNLQINNTKELWNEINVRAQFNKSDIDDDLLKDLKARLNIDGNKDFETQIESIPLETFIDALFSSLEPFSLMMTDLLALFERIGAQKGDNNLQIEIDFDKLNNSKFNFNINNFRQSVKAFEQTYNVGIREYKVKNPFGMLKPFDWNRYELSQFIAYGFEEIAYWVENYENGKWSDWFPSQPYIGIAELDGLIKIFWEFISRTYMRIGKACNFKGDRPQKVNQLSNEINSYNDIKDAMLWAENDHITKNMVVQITQNIIEIKQLSALEAEKRAEELKLKIQEYLNSLDIRYYSVTQKIELIHELFNLPVWNHRHELYSAWIFTLIVKAFGDMNLIFHLKQGVLSFSFGGSHLATCTDTTPNLELYAELKTKAIVKLVSEKREKHIQPDYSIAFNDVASPGNSVAVVECKQYKKSSVSNFSEAVIDYVNNRPGAEIFLVNYGNISKGVNQCIIQNGINQRYATIEYVKPQSMQAENFVRRLNEVVEQYRAKLIGFCAINLTWGAMPLDLDLELIYTRDSDANKINYGYLGSQFVEPYAALDKDDRNGYGNETISVYQWTDGQYDFYVNNFSGENVLDADICVTISSANFKKTIKRCQPFTKDYRWHVLEIKNGLVKIIDEIELCKPN